MRMPTATKSRDRQFNGAVPSTIRQAACGSGRVNDMIKKQLPLKIILEIDSTNLSTRRYALEAVIDLMHTTGHSQPKYGQIIRGPYWRAKVVKRVDSLPKK